MKKVEMKGQKFHRLFVLNEMPHAPNRHIAWKCQCDCGNIVVVSGAKLRNGNTKSCGCLKTDNRKAPLGQGGTLTHGMAKTPEYNIWRAMKNRCFNSNQESYKRYGDRGITVCKGWVDSFETFIADMGLRPHTSYSIDRINTDGPYSCGHCKQCQEKGWSANCRWATQKEQHNNRRSTLWLTYENQTLTMKEWAIKKGISYHTLYARIIKSFWPIDIAFNTLPDSSNRIERL